MASTVFRSVDTNRSLRFSRPVLGNAEGPGHADLS